jgi:hypothetical protein
LYVTDLGLSRLQQAGSVGVKELGKLEFVGSTPTAEFRGINNYAIGGKQVRGSIKPNSKEIAPDTWEAPQFQHLASILANPLEGGVRIDRCVKLLSNAYTRRKPLDNGRTIPHEQDVGTIPYRVAEEDQG